VRLTLLDDEHDARHWNQRSAHHEEEEEPEVGPVAAVKLLVVGLNQRVVLRHDFDAAAVGLQNRIRGPVDDLGNRLVLARVDNCHLGSRVFGVVEGNAPLGFTVGAEVFVEICEHEVV